MNNQDRHEIEMFTKGLSKTIEETTKELYQKGIEFPDTITFLVKKEDGYGLSGGLVPENKIERMIHNEVLPKMICDLNECEILCRCETFYDNGKMRIEFENYLTEEKEEVIFTYENELPMRKSDFDVCVLGEPICLN
jgi:hypothetical protein